MPRRGSVANHAPAVRSYQERGYVIFRDVIDTELVREASAHVDWLLKRYPECEPELLGDSLRHDDPFWHRLVGDDRLLDVAEAFIGPDIAVFGSSYFCKLPGEGKPIGWHQDGQYWPLVPMEVVSLWVAVDASVPENGCMHVIPGTHRMEIRDRHEAVTDVFLSGVDEWRVDESEAVNLVLQPGDVSVHHPNIVHGSNANTSDRRRCGLTIRYIPTTTRIQQTDWTVPGRWPAFLVRGNPRDDINTYLPRPTYIPGRHMPFRGSEAWM